MTRSSWWRTSRGTGRCVTAAPRMQAAIEAVAEVGNPTVVATLTVIAALLPMLFVSGLMGPYMAPIPANASAAMLFSFFVAMVVAPWLLLKLSPEQATGRRQSSRRGPVGPAVSSRRHAAAALAGSGLDIPADCRRRHHRRLRAVLHRSCHGETAAVRQQVGTRGGAEPAGRQQPGGHRAQHCSPPPTSCAGCRRCARCRPMPAPPRRSTSTAWCGTTYMRQSPELGDLQINLADKADRDRSSHAIALDLRRRLARTEAAAGQHAASGGGAAWTAGAGHTARRDLWPRRGDAARGGGAGEGIVPLGAVHRRCHRFVWPSAAAIAREHRSGRAGIFRRRAERCVRHGAGVVRRRARGLFASRRGARSDRDPHRAAEVAI